MREQELQQMIEEKKRRKDKEEWEEKERERKDNERYLCAIRFE